MKRHDIVGGAVGVVVAATLLTLMVAIGNQILGWLKSGIWIEFQISRALDLTVANWPTTDWKGLQKIIDFTLNLHVGFMVVLVGCVSGWGLFIFLDRITGPLPPHRP